MCTASRSSCSSGPARGVELLGRRVVVDARGDLLGELRGREPVVLGVPSQVGRCGRGGERVDDGHGDPPAVVAGVDRRLDAVRPLELRPGIPARRVGAGARREGGAVRGRVHRATVGIDRAGHDLLAPVRRARLAHPEAGRGLVRGVRTGERHRLVEPDDPLDGAQAARHHERGVVGPQLLALDGVVGEGGPERRAGLGHRSARLDVLAVVGDVADLQPLRLQPSGDTVDVGLGRGELLGVLRRGEEGPVEGVARRGDGRRVGRGRVAAPVVEVDPEVDLGVLVGRADLVGRLRPQGDTVRKGVLAVAGCGEGGTGGRCCDGAGQGDGTERSGSRAGGEGHRSSREVRAGCPPPDIGKTAK